MTEKFKKHRLLAPGPVPMPPEVLNALAQPMIHHRTPQFTEELVAAHKKLQASFQTKQPVFILTSTGSGAMEAAVTNTLSPGDEVVVVVGGKFGQRWSKMCKAYGLKVHDIEVTWGEPVELGTLKKLVENNSIKAVLCQACETSTGTWHPVEKIAQYLAHKDTLFMVDAITGIGTAALPMDELSIDVLVSGSQKAFMIPTGLSFIALSDKAWAATKIAKIAKFYFDLTAERAAYDKQQTLFSSPVNHIRALNVALDYLTGEPLQQSIQKTQNLARATRQAAKSLGLKVFSKAPCSALTAIEVPAEIDGAKLRQHIETQYNITMMGGQDHLKGKIIRIGHLGYILPDDLEAGVHALALALKDFGWSDFDEERLQSTLTELKTSLVQ